MHSNESRDITKTSFPKFYSFLAALIVVTMISACAGSSRTASGAKTGALVGAGLGLLIGALGGKPEAGLAVGAAYGAAGGAYEGWRQEQDDERTRQITDAIRESKRSAAAQQNADAAARAREELTRFLGIWSMEGWAQEPGEERLNVRAQVNGDVEMNYFVKLAYIGLKVTGFDSQLWGTTMLGYDDENGYNISSHFNTMPGPVRASGGKFDRSNRSFSFKGPDFRIVVRFENPDRFTAETIIIVGGREHKLESYRFTRI